MSNGRVPGILFNDNFRAYQLFQDNGRQGNFNREAVIGVHTNNPLADVFFSQQNIDVLQDAIRYLVYKKSCGKYTISRQSDAELKLIMRAIYLQDGQHKQYDILGEVKQLNTQVLNYAVPRIVQEINMYMHYKKDIDRVPEPLPRGEFISAKGTRQVEVPKDYFKL